MVTVILGLGSNMGGPVANIRWALRAIDDEIGPVRAVSSAYETEAIGFADQPDFVNAVAIVESELQPAEVLRAAQVIETRLGRTRTIMWGPRVMDIDVLFYDDRIVESPELVIPHPRIGERLFVLAPLAEVAPDWPIPGVGKAKDAAALLIGKQRCERIPDVRLWSPVREEDK